MHPIPPAPEVHKEQSSEDEDLWATLCMTQAEVREVVLTTESQLRAKGP